MQKVHVINTNKSRQSRFRGRFVPYNINFYLVCNLYVNTLRLFQSRDDGDILITTKCWQLNLVNWVQVSLSHSPVFLELFLNRPDHLCTLFFHSKLREWFNTSASHNTLRGLNFVRTNFRELKKFAFRED